MLLIDTQQREKSAERRRQRLRDAGLVLGIVAILASIPLIAVGVVATANAPHAGMKH